MNNLYNCPKCKTSKPLEESKKIEGMIYYHYKCSWCDFEVDLLTPVQNEAVILWNQACIDYNNDISNLIEKINDKYSLLEELEEEIGLLEDERSDIENKMSIDKTNEYSYRLDEILDEIYFLENEKSDIEDDMLKSVKKLKKDFNINYNEF